MKVQFVYMGAENLGLEYISSRLKNAGHEVGLTFDPALFYDKHYLNIDFLARIFDATESIVNDALSARSDIIAFSVFTHNYQWALKIASLIKEKENIPIIFGGIHPTILPEKVIHNHCVDMVCIGEGEDAFVELLDSCGKNEGIKNIWFKNDKEIIKNPLRELKDDLDSLPFPDKTLFKEYMDMKSKYTITTSRGCPFKCSYCSLSTLREIYRGKGPFLRLRSIDNVLEEIVWAKERVNFKYVDFQDNIFTINTERMELLLEKYRKHVGLPFQCISHPRYMNSKIAKLLKKSGCCLIEIGIQSIDEFSRKHTLNRPETNAEIQRALDCCRDSRLPFQVDHIFGIPGEQEQALIDAAEFYIKNRPQKIGCFWLSYFPQTKIVDTALEMNCINKDDLENINDGLGKILHFGGSIKDKEKKGMIKGFEVLFKLIPVIPENFAKHMLKKRWDRYFKFFPFFIVLLIDVFASIRQRSFHSFSYMKYYFKHMARRLRT